MANNKLSKVASQLNFVQQVKSRPAIYASHISRAVRISAGASFAVGSANTTLQWARRKWHSGSICSCQVNWNIKKYIHKDMVLGKGLAF